MKGMDSNATRARPEWPPVVVAGAYQTGIVLMRNLWRRGVKVACIDSNPNMPGFKTVYGKGYRCPDADEHPEEWVAYMAELAGKLGVRPVLIPSSDRFITVVGDHADELNRHFIFPRQSAATQSLLATKQKQYEIADAHGLPTPRTKFVTSVEELREFMQDARFPCLLKPRHFREWQKFPAGHPLSYEKVTVADNAAQLEERYRLAETVSPQMVVQEVIQGPDTNKVVYLSCYRGDGERIGYCVLREVRTDPIGFGSASVVVPVRDDEVDQRCDSFLRSLGYTGLCEIELKRDIRDNSLKIIEANPRYSVTADAAPYLGVDLGWLHYLDLIGQKVTPVAPEVRDFRHVCLRRDFATYRSYRKAGQSWRQLLSAYKPPAAYFDFDWRDRRNTLDTLWACFKLVVKPWFKR